MEYWEEGRSAPVNSLQRTAAERTDSMGGGRASAKKTLGVYSVLQKFAKNIQRLMYRFVEVYGGKTEIYDQNVDKPRKVEMCWGHNSANPTLLQ